MQIGKDEYPPIPNTTFGFDFIKNKNDLKNAIIIFINDQMSRIGFFLKIVDEFIILTFGNEYFLIYLKPLLSITISVKIFFSAKYFAKLNAGNTCPPVPPVAIIIFFFSLIM